MSDPEYPLTDDPNTTFACPGCDSCNVKQTKPGRWICTDCSANGFEPIEREQKAPWAGAEEGHRGGGKSKHRLEELDPEDVGLNPVGSR